jgi:hypothetical protein
MAMQALINREGWAADMVAKQAVAYADADPSPRGHSAQGIGSERGDLSRNVGRCKKEAP